MTMTTITVPAAAWATAIRPGDTLTAIDDFPIDPQPIVAVEGDVLRLASDRSVTAVRLYPGSHDSATVHRQLPYAPSRRELAALRRNPHYVDILRQLAAGPIPAGSGVYYGTIASHYPWIEPGPRVRGRNTWQLTATGRALLAYLDRHTP